MRRAHTRGTAQVRGFTLIEVMVVVAIITILTGLSAAGLSLFARNSSLTLGAQVVLAATQEARARTLASQGDTQYGVHYDTDQVVLFEGATYVAGAAENEVRPLSSRVSIAAITLTGSVSEVVFSRLRGEASATGSVTVQLVSDASQTATLNISAAGLAELL